MICLASKAVVDEALFNQRTSSVWKKIKSIRRSLLGQLNIVIEGNVDRLVIVTGRNNSSSGEIQ